ncbi:MAG: histidine kinase dimerization/phospho-acceptor domain-containing protein [Croceibacterium sp.]
MFDDRLATVLRTDARSETGVRTQYRQLLDLLGTMPADETNAVVQAAYIRLGELAEKLPAADQSQILRAPGLRLRNRTLVGWLAGAEPQAAAAALATARLAERDWLYLIPRVPVTARGFLRHRRDLPLAVRQVLERLGVRDLVLPDESPAAVPAAIVQPPAPLSAPALARPVADAGIGALVRRIEAFQKARREATPAAMPAGPREVRTTGFDFATDALGSVVWADPAVAPIVVGVTLGDASEAAVARLDPASAAALRERQPMSAGRIFLTGAEAIAGDWHIDAAPLFDHATGGFRGHAGRLRRPASAGSLAAQPDTPGDRMREVLHELRTPVNAIQGFAEIIQQQLFGPAPHEYRALAAGVAVDAARLMAGFDELDRLAQLDSGTLELADGSSDLRQGLAQLLRRLDGVLRPRSARLVLTVSGSPFEVPLEPGDALAMLWRVLATLAGAMAPGEVAELHLSGDGKRVVLRAELPATLLGEPDLFAAAAPAPPRAVSAGMFGTGFAFRLARAEAAAAGGSLARADEALILDLPALTASPALHTVLNRG